MKKEFDINNKSDWVEAVRAVVYAIQKARSIDREVNDELPTVKLNEDQMRIRNYILGMDKPEN